MSTSSRGFTLLEVLVALVVLALALSALIRSTAMYGAHLNDARERTYAQWVAANVVSRARLSGRIPTDTAISGEVEMGDMRWRWQMQASPMQLAGVRQIDVHVENSKGIAALRLNAYVGDRQ